MKFLKVDGVARDKANSEIRRLVMCQRANARFMAVCPLCGTGEITNRVVKDKTQIKRNIRKQAGCFHGKGRACAYAIEAWSVSFPIVLRHRWVRRRPSSSAIARSKCVSARYLPEHFEYPYLPKIRAFYRGSHYRRRRPAGAAIGTRSAEHVRPGPPIGSPRAKSRSGALECCPANGIAASV